MFYYLIFMSDRWSYKPDTIGIFLVFKLGFHFFYKAIM